MPVWWIFRLGSRSSSALPVALARHVATAVYGPPRPTPRLHLCSPRAGTQAAVQRRGVNLRELGFCVAGLNRFLRLCRLPDGIAERQDALAIVSRQRRQLGRRNILKTAPVDVSIWLLGVRMDGRRYYRLTPILSIWAT